MNLRSRALILAAFGLATVASGVYRFASAEGGEKGLWFGIVMGGTGLGGAALLARGRRRAGSALGWIAVVFVGGWFAYEALVKKGFDQAEPRQLALIVAAIAVAPVLVGARAEPAGERRVEAP